MGVDAILLGGLQAEECAGQAEHHLVSAPVGDVKMGVVVALHHLAWVAAEVAPVVLVGEGGGGDPGPGGQRADLGLLPFIQRVVDGQELVVLVFAHIRLLSGGPVPVSIDPFSTGRGRGGQWQIQDVDGLPVLPAGADRDNPAAR